MNLSYVRSYLNNKPEGMSAEDVSKLLEEIDAYIGTDNTFNDIASIMRTIHEYNMSYLSEIREYSLIPKDDPKQLPKRLEKARGILCTLSTLHTYLVLSRANVTESTYNMKSVRSYLADLDAKKEHYKTEKMAWITILKSLTQEIAFIAEMRRLDLEDKIGYGKSNG